MLPPCPIPLNPHINPGPTQQSRSKSPKINPKLHAAWGQPQFSFLPVQQADQCRGPLPKMGYLYSSLLCCLALALSKAEHRHTLPERKGCRSPRLGD